MSDRKYRQRGYQDENRPSPSRGPKRSGPRDPTERPRGRGLGKPTAVVFRCAVCGSKNEGPKNEGQVNLPADATCVKCGSDLHTCTHCAWFDSGAPNECRKPDAVYVASKAKRNSCELFEPKAAKEFASEPENPKDAKSAFDALFNF